MHEGHHQHDHAGLPDLLDLDAEVFGRSLGKLTEWTAELAPDHPRTIVDIGAGTGAGSRALARRFGAARVIAIDTSPVMLDRIRAISDADSLAHRVSAVAADLNAGLPDVGTIDLAWAALSLHEVADPDRLLREVHDAMRPGGLVMVVEMGGPPSFLPDDVGWGRPGLEQRFQEAVLRSGWNTYPDWAPYLNRAGYTLLERRAFTLEADADDPSAARYARTFVNRMRATVDDRLDAADLEALDLLLADGPSSLSSRRDLSVRGSRVAWAARR